MINLRDLERSGLEGTVTIAVLRAAGVVTRSKKPVKVLAMGEVTKALDLKVNAVSAKAQGEDRGGRRNRRAGQVREEERHRIMANVFQSLQSIFKIPELKRRVLYTLGMLIVYRLGGHVPTAGVNGEALAAYFKQQQGSLLGLYDMFVGGAFSQATIFALGIMPYISASIILQLFTAVIPYFEKLQKMGEEGRKKITQYTRYGTVLLALVQSYAASMYLQSLPAIEGSPIVPNPGLGFRLLTMLTMTTGTIFVMWLGEQISEKGIGNGISLIIFIGIVARYPTDWLNTFRALRIGSLNIFGLAILIVDDGRHRRRGRADAAGPAADTGAVREAGRRAEGLRRAEHAHPAQAEHRRRHPDHLRPVDHHVPRHDRRLLQGQRVHGEHGGDAAARRAALHDPLRRHHRLLRLLLHGDHLQSGRPRRQHEEVRRVRAREATGQEDGGVHRQRSDAG